MTARALLVPDCGAGVGLGHLERMLALADALRPDPAVAVVVPTEDDALRRRVTRRGHDAVDVAGGLTARARAVARWWEAEVIVLDGYGIDVETQSALRAVARLVVVDDLGHPADCDLAVNPSPGGEALPPEGARAFLGGAAYAVLPAAVLDARAARSPTPRGRSVLVSTGAMDARGITAQVAVQLLRLDPDVTVVVVAGPEMRRADIPESPRVDVLVEPASLAGSLGSATLYAGAAGTTAVQAACVGTPAVVTAVADNQREQAAALAAAGCAVVTEPDDIARACLVLLDDPARCAVMAERGRDLVDGGGATRVADAIRRLVRARVA